MRSFLPQLIIFSIVALVNADPKCTVTLNHRGQIAPGSPCCINSFGETKCLNRDLSEDTAYMKVAPDGATLKRWAQDAVTRDSILKAEKKNSEIADSIKRVLSDSLADVENKQLKIACKKSANRPRRLKDGSYVSIRDHLLKYLKDPSSFKPDRWGPPEPAEDYSWYCYDVAVRYRAKNGYGGYDIFNETYHLGIGGVVVGTDADKP